MVEETDLVFDRRSGYDRRSKVDRRTVNNFDRLFFSRTERRRRIDRRAFVERRSGWLKSGTFHSSFITGAGRGKRVGSLK